MPASHQSTGHPRSGYLISRRRDWTPCNQPMLHGRIPQKSNRGSRVPAKVTANTFIRVPGEGLDPQPPMLTIQKRLLPALKQTTERRMGPGSQATTTRSILGGGPVTRRVTQGCRNPRTHWRGPCWRQGCPHTASVPVEAMHRQVEPVADEKVPTIPHPGPSF